MDASSTTTGVSRAQLTVVDLARAKVAVVEAESAMLSTSHASDARWGSPADEARTMQREVQEATDALAALVARSDPGSPAHLAIVSAYATIRAVGEAIVPSAVDQAGSLLRDRSLLRGTTQLGIEYLAGARADLSRAQELLMRFDDER